MLKVSKLRTAHFLMIAMAAAFLALQSGCSSLGTLFQNPRYVYESGAVLVRGDNRPIELQKNSQAVNVTYAEVVDFIRADATDRHQYVARGADSGLAYVCSDFAELVFNNAQAAGIRAGYMTIDFADSSIGHAVNAFETTDRGMVYIDCTGPGDTSQLEGESQYDTSTSWDKVAYVEIGQAYGIISLDMAQATTYEYYAQFEQKWADYREMLSAYNAEVKQYNREISGRTFQRGSLEISRMRTWESQLEDKEKALASLQAEIGEANFKPLGIVKSFDIHW